MLEIIDTTDETSAEEVAQIVAATDLIDIRVDQVAAGPVTIGGDQIQARLVRGHPQYAYVEEQGGLMVRLEHKLECIGPAGDESSPTTITVFHLLIFEVNDAVTVEASALSAWIRTNVYFMAYPYVRHFMTVMTSAMGLPPVVLGYLKRDEWPEFEPADGALATEEDTAAEEE